VSTTTEEANFIHSCYWLSFQFSKVLINTTMAVPASDYWICLVPIWSQARTFVEVLTQAIIIFKEFNPHFNVVNFPTAVKEAKDASQVKI